MILKSFDFQCDFDFQIAPGPFQNDFDLKSPLFRWFDFDFKIMNIWWFWPSFLTTMIAINQVVLANLYKLFIVLAIGVINFANCKCKNNKKINDNRKKFDGVYNKRVQC